MVLVQPPVQRVSAESAEKELPATARWSQGARHDSTSGTRVDGFGLEGIEELLDQHEDRPAAPEAPPASPPPMVDATTPGDGVGISEQRTEALADEPTTEPTELTDEGTDEATDEATDEPIVGQPLPPNSQWMSRESKQLRQWLVGGAAMVFGVVGVIGLAAFMLRGDTTSVSQGDAAQGKPLTDSAQNNPAEPSGENSASNPESNPVGPPSSAATQLGQGEPSDPNDPGDPGEVEPPLGAIGGPNEPGKATPRQDPQDVDPTPKEPQEPKEPQGADALELPGGPKRPGEPLDLPGGPDDPLSPFPGSGASVEELLNEEGFSGLEAMLEDSTTLAPTIAPSESDPDKRSRYALFGAELNPARRPPGMHIDSTRLETTVSHLNMVDQPLQSVLQFMMDMSTVPITIDPMAVIHSRVSPTASVTCQGTNQSIQSLTAAAVAPLGLELQVRPRHARLLISDHDKVIEYDFPAQDLGPNPEQQKWLSDTIQRVIQPGQWAPNTDASVRWVDGKLRVKQHRLGMFETLELLETLRTARELPSQANIPPERRPTGPRRSRAIPKLKRKTRIIVRSPRPLGDVLNKLTEQTDMRFLVDWEAVESKEWNRNATVNLLTENESLAVALRLLLTPMALDYLVLDGDTLMITTPEATAQWRELGLYPAPDLVPAGNDVALAITDVQRLLGPELFERSTGNVLAFDEVSRSLIARLSQDNHRRMQELLNKMRQAPR